jgi:uncharacterized membrane protein YuzA (DUF378 family)
MNKKTTLKSLAFLTTLLSAIGAINWGLIGAFGMNGVENLLGSCPTLVRAIYILIGLSGIYLLVLLMVSCCNRKF